MEFVFGTDIEIPFSPYPSDVQSEEEWDLYWSYRRLSPHSGELWPRCDPQWLDVFEERGYRSILFAGNGISQEPQFFAYAGFLGWALDVSPVAIAEASKRSWREQDLLGSFGIAKKEARGFLREIHRFGGSARYEVGDLFDAEACPGPFDVVITRHTLQMFGEKELLRGLEALLGRLAHGGAMVVEVSDDPFSRMTVEKELTRRGFRLWPSLEGVVFATQSSSLESFLTTRS